MITIFCSMFIDNVPKETLVLFFGLDLITLFVGFIWGTEKAIRHSKVVVGLRERNKKLEKEVQEFKIKELRG